MYTAKKTRTDAKKAMTEHIHSAKDDTSLVMIVNDGSQAEVLASQTSADELLRAVEVLSRVFLNDDEAMPLAMRRLMLMNIAVNLIGEPAHDIDTASAVN